MAEVVLFLCGDVMTGRGVDQILAYPSEPQLYEPAVQSAMGYVQLAEMKTGPIPRPVAPAYVWGDALAVLEHAKPPSGWFFFLLIVLPPISSHSVHFRKNEAPTKKRQSLIPLFGRRSPPFEM